MNSPRQLAIKTNVIYLMDNVKLCPLKLSQNGDFGIGFDIGMVYIINW